MQTNVFIIGSKGIPARYGGFETFVDRITEYSKNKEIFYHVSCLANQGENSLTPYEYNGARCVPLKVPNIGPAKAVLYDILALRHCLRYMVHRQIVNATVLILACRIGPFMWLYKKRLKKLGARLIVNPDGHEWRRAKWNVVIKKYWKISERLMVKQSDMVVCDSIEIEKYIQSEYQKYKPHTVFIPYGARVNERTNICKDWLLKRGLLPYRYFLVVGRFEPENNFEIMIREYMLGKTEMPLIIITNDNPKFYAKLQRKLDFEKDSRIHFVGTVYDKTLLTSIRQNAYAYIHGHEVGGTNPSLLEALACTDFNLLLDCEFNREVGGETAFYWNKTKGALSALIDNVASDFRLNRAEWGRRCKRRIESLYNWDDVVEKYELLFAENMSAGAY